MITNTKIAISGVIIPTEHALDDSVFWHETNQNVKVMANMLARKTPLKANGRAIPLLQFVVKFNAFAHINIINSPLHDHMKFDIKYHVIAFISMGMTLFM